MDNRVFLFNTPNYFDIFYKDMKKRGLVIIVPGGGYDHCSLKEGSSVSNSFLEEGYHTVILKYRETLDLAPMPMKELMYTIDYMRHDDLVIKDKIIVIGFSAGAHLVGSVASHYMEYPMYDARPNLCVLSYPVISSNPLFWHEGSFKNLLGNNNSEEMLKYYDISLNCHEHFPPTFLWHTATDESVNYMNSVLMVNALKKNNIKFEYHLFPSGVHGLSMATEESAMGDLIKVNKYVSRWFKMCIDFINDTL